MKKIKKRDVAIVTIITLIIVFGIPLLINAGFDESSSLSQIFITSNNGEVIDNRIKTVFEAEDLLYYSGSALAFIGTLILGAIAIWQNNKANEINQRLLTIEQGRNRPIIDYKNLFPQDSKDVFVELFAHEGNQIVVRVYLKNIGDGIAKSCKVIGGDLFSMNNHYVFEKEGTEEIGKDRAIISGDHFHLHSYYSQVVVSEKITEINSFFEKQAPGKIGDIPMTNGMYILDLKLEIISLDELTYHQKIWCFFKKKSESEDGYWMNNRIIEL